MKTAEFKSNRKEVIAKASSLFRERMLLATQNLLSGHTPSMNLSSLLFNEDVFTTSPAFALSHKQSTTFLSLGFKQQDTRKRYKNVPLQSSLNMY